MYEFDEKLLVAGLPAQAEAAHILGAWWVCFWPGGLSRPECRKKGAITPTVEQTLYAKNLCRKLNRELHLGGMWLTAWAEPAGAYNVPQRFVLLWKDPDGDVPFTLDNDERYAKQLLIPLEEWVSDAEQAWLAWREVNKKMDIRPQDQIKAALGEQSADPRASIPMT